MYGMNGWNKPDGDLISRAAVLEELADLYWTEERFLTFKNVDSVFDRIKALPSAQPERKTGKWIKVNGKTAINCSTCYHCSWSLSFEDTVKRFNFCPICGADMRGEG